MRKSYFIKKDKTEPIDATRHIPFLIIFTVLFFISCSSYSKTTEISIYAKLYFNTSHLELFAPPQKETKKTHSWSRFESKVKDVGKITFYTWVKNKLSPEEKEKYAGNFEEILRKQYDYELNNAQELKDFVVLDIKPMMVFVHHENPTSYEVPMDGKNFNKGHAWIIVNATTHINIFMVYEGAFIELRISCEYEPALKTGEEAKGMFETKKGELKKILEKIIMF